MIKIIRKKLLHYFFYFFCKTTLATFLLKQLNNNKINFFDNKIDGLEKISFKILFFSKISRYHNGQEIKFKKKFKFKSPFIMELKLNEFTQNGYYFNIPHNGLGTLMQLMNNKVFIDIGANVGVFSLMASQIFKEVYSFELMKENYTLLKNNLKLNKISNVKAYNYALGENQGYGKMIINPLNNGGTSVKQLDKKSENSLKIFTLDQFNFKNVDLIKIDVEGSELEVLKGLKETKDNYCPTFFIEVSSSLESVRKISTVLGKDYQSYFPPNNNLIANDMIFVHKKNRDLVKQLKILDF